MWPRSATSARGGDSAGSTRLSKKRWANHKALVEARPHPGFPTGTRSYTMGAATAPREASRATARTNDGGTHRKPACMALPRGMWGGGARAMQNVIRCMAARPVPNSPSIGLLGRRCRTNLWFSGANQPRNPWRRAGDGADCTGGWGVSLHAMGRFAPPSCLKQRQQSGAAPRRRFDHPPKQRPLTMLA
jgi:hypothetical protein